MEAVFLAPQVTSSWNLFYDHSYSNEPFSQLGHAILRQHVCLTREGSVDLSWVYLYYIHFRRLGYFTFHALHIFLCLYIFLSLCSRISPNIKWANSCCSNIWKRHRKIRTLCFLPGQTKKRSFCFLLSLRSRLSPFPYVLAYLLTSSEPTHAIPISENSIGRFVLSFFARAN